ncbi:MAG: hypothetical protein JOY82_05725 [Streptosporangiaceae bacterium]|nr:hypothetical protein [Streptosporangiaceae bacterium]MBV9854008.1 hypothetical protein [Streptosporangiaceae bacterium]
MTSHPRPALLPDPDALVAAYLRPGMHVHLSATMSRPNALIYALARVFGPAGGKLTVSTTAIHSSAHALALAGVVDRAVTCFLGDTYPSPRPNPLYRRVNQGEPFIFEGWSLLSYLQRLVAGATGLPYAVTTSLAGSDLMLDKAGTAFTVPDPAGSGQDVTLLTPLCPDYTLVHAVCADRRGNLVLCAPMGEGPWGALAARRGVLASAERIVPDAVIDSQPDRVVVPGHRVAGLCEAPFGAHPQSLRTAGIAGLTAYLDDYPFTADITTACAQPDTALEWYRTWVEGPGGHAGYLAKLGKERLAGLELPAGTAPRATVAPDPPGGPLTDQQRLIVLGARCVAEAVQTRGYGTLLAGIGASHMAAWLAAALLRLRGIDVEVASELGFNGVDPAAGDAYLFSQRHATRSTQLAGIAEILGALVAGNRGRCLGVLAAAEVDSCGNLNTSRLGDGRHITGSGGANDIASAADCVVVATASRRRYVRQVAYVTSPGRRIQAVVSQFGRFTRPGPDQPFELRTWLPPEAPASANSPRAAVAALTDWPCPDGGAGDGREGWRAEEPVSALERTLLRQLDPEGIYR